MFRYPYYYPKQSNTDKIIDGFLIGIIISLIIIIIWWVWAVFIYRWSDERIGSYIIQKFSQQNNDKISDNTYFKERDIKLNDDKATVSAVVDKKTKDSDNKTLDSYTISYDIRSSCGILDDCLNL